MFECIWIFWISIASFVLSMGVAYHGYMSRLIDPEELLTEEYDPDYTEDLRNDLPCATSHPTS
jgi:hypothetical protein